MSQKSSMLTPFITSVVVILTVGALLRQVRPLWVRWSAFKPYRNRWQLFKSSYRVERTFQIEQTYRAAVTDRAQRPANLAYTYGEIPFATLVAVLAKVNPKAGETFYDLGSGDGKAVISAALIAPFGVAKGIEALPSLHHLSDDYLIKFRQLAELPQHFHDCQINFVQDDFFSADFSDGDVIYVNATGLFAQDWDNLVNKFSQLRPNSRVICVSREIHDPQFNLLDARWRMMSWGMNRLFIYQKR